MIRRSETDRTLAAALLCAAVVIGTYLGIEPLRDDLFQEWNIQSELPKIKILAALASIAAALAYARISSRIDPIRLLANTLVASAAIMLASWGLVFWSRKAAAVAVYIHLAAFGLVLIAGFWSAVEGRYDPRTARRLVGWIGGGGTLGGLCCCGFFAVAKDPKIVLPVYAVLHLVCAGLVRQLKAPEFGVKEKPSGGGMQVLRKTPYLRSVALLLFLVSTSLFFLEYVFQNHVQLTCSEESRAAFFGWYYFARQIATLALQIGCTRWVLQELGLAGGTALAPLTIVAGGAGALVVPGFAYTVAFRGVAEVFRDSTFEAGYEILYTPLPPRVRRAAKAPIDVGADASGEILGSLLVLFCQPILKDNINPASVMAAIALSLGGLFVCWRLRQAYIRELERSLIDRAVELNLEDVHDHTTRTILTRSLAGALVSFPASTPTENAEPSTPLDPVRGRLSDLGSGDPARVREALEGGPLDAALAAQVIPLLAWDAVAEDAQRALRRAGAGVARQLMDAMLDTRQEFTVRRRVPRVLAAFPSARTVEALLVALNDRRFEVRYRCGKALAAVLSQDAGLSVTNEQILPIVLRELELSKRLWRSQRLLDGCEEDELVGDRADHGLAHVFALLSLILPKEPLRLSFQALHTDNEMLRGTALEYLESVLPAPIRDRLWPFLEDKRPAAPSQRSREVILAELLLSHESIRVRLQELRARRAPSA